MQERTEEATPRKRQREREEGRVAQSRDFTGAFVLASALAAVYFFAQLGSSSFFAFFRWSLGGIPSAGLAEEGWALRFFDRGTLCFLGIWLPVAMAASLTAIGLSCLQVGVRISPLVFLPRFDRFNPVTGIGRMFGRRSLAEALKALVKAAVLFTLFYNAVRKEIPAFSDTAGISGIGGFSFVFPPLLRISVKLTFALAVIGLFDLLYQKWEFSRSIRMTKQELKDDFRQTEGDPLVRQRIRSRQAEIGRKRMMAKVPDADVVIANPTHVAVALKYDRTKMKAPMVVARGADRIALKIREVADENGIPVIEDRPLARSLFAETELDREIPEKFFVAVAEILAHVYGLARQAKDRFQQPKEGIAPVRVPEEAIPPRRKT
ncbi:MAG: flagellar biosynthesis protein FlhB [Synergistales bacterium]